MHTAKSKRQVNSEYYKRKKNNEPRLRNLNEYSAVAESLSDVVLFS